MRNVNITSLAPFELANGVLGLYLPHIVSTVKCTLNDPHVRV